MVGGPARFGQLNKCLGKRFLFVRLVPTVLAPFRMPLVAGSFSVPVGGKIMKKYFHSSKDRWFSGTFFPDIFEEFLLLRKGDTGIRDIARSMRNCANGIGQSFKDTHKGWSGVADCVQFCTGKKIIWILLEKAHAAFLKGEKDEEENNDRKGKTDAQNKMDAS